LNIDFSKMRQVINPAYFPLLFDKSRYLLLYGGAGSGKSYFAAQKVLLRILADAKRGRKHKFLVLRKTQPAARKSVYALLKYWLAAWGMLHPLVVRENKVEMTFTFWNGSVIICGGLDDREKLKSVEGVTGMWLEEPTELSRDDFLQANLRLRGRRNVYKQIIMSFNPISKMNWLYEEFFAKERRNAKILRTTYKDNLFIDEEYIQELLYLAEQDSTYYQVYAEGEWGVLQNIIYSTFDVSSESWPETFDEKIYGLDFGFNVQSALVEINWYDGHPFERELLYERKLTNQDLIGQLEALGVDKGSPIYADSAEPDRIQEIENAGYLVYPAQKRVKDGIDYVKRMRPTIHPESVNLLKEVESYKWKEDRHGNVLDEPVKFRDHLMDARRYAYYTHARGNLGELPDWGSLGGLGAVR